MKRSIEWTHFYFTLTDTTHDYFGPKHVILFHVRLKKGFRKRLECVEAFSGAARRVIILFILVIVKIIR